jgi:sporulation protein YlmC with PRC-barrel domain
MKKIAIAPVVAAALTGGAYAQQTTGVGGPVEAQVLTAIPQSATTITGFYKQNVYAPSSNLTKVGEIKDVLFDKDGKVSAFIIGVGDFIGKKRTDSGVAMPFLDERNVAVPFDAIHATTKDGQRWLIMNIDMDSLSSAPAYKFDKTKATWVPA